MSGDTVHRILICGVGSIGERHIRNLLALGYERIALFRTRISPFRNLDRHFPVYTDLETAISAFSPTIAFVTNPTALHMPVALKAARAGCHLLIEKPVSHKLDGMDELQSVLDTHGCVAMVGYILRFHPLLQMVKTWLDEGSGGTLGDPLFVRSSWGEHVPDWHPWEDYRSSYSVLRGLGGGPALTLSHEFDVLVWMFGTAIQVIGMSSNHTPLQTDCEHVIDVLIRHRNGVTANVHLDYCQRPPSRSWELICTRGRVLLDYSQGTLTRWDGIVGEIPSVRGVREAQAQVFSLREGFDRNDLFMDELRYFFDCLRRGEPPSPGIAEAAHSVRIALSALQGAAS